MLDPALNCSRCRADNPPGARFCSACGQPLGSACRKCGAELVAGQRFCNAFGLDDLPIVGPVLFAQTWLVYASWVCVVVVGYYLSRTRPGLNVRAVGESPAAADAMGISVTKYRYLHTIAGGAFADPA